MPTSAFCILHFASCILFVASLTQVFTAPQSSPAVQPSSAAAPADAEKPLATIKQYCVACHNDRAKTGGVSFQGITPESVSQHADVFEKAVRKLRGTALEYLEGVLPQDLSQRLWPFLGREQQAPRDVRARDEILADLLRSNESIMLNLEELRKRVDKGA